MFIIFSLIQVEAIRMQLNRENCRDVTTCISDNTIELIPPSESQDKDRLYIVIDTNIFLSNLALVEEAKNANFKNHSRPFIVIPWTVICVSLSSNLLLLIYYYYIY